MFTTSLLRDEGSDNLAKVLADPKKSAEMLKKLRDENDRIKKNTKELVEGKSIKIYCEKKKAEADAAVSTAKKAIEGIEIERKKAQKSTNDARSRIEKREAKVKASETLCDKVAIDLKDLNDQLTLRECSVQNREENAAKEIRAAGKVRAEYEGKLADLKQRMKGL
jgi:chromosome segregation ATPase